MQLHHTQLTGSEDLAQVPFVTHTSNTHVIYKQVDQSRRQVTPLRPQVLLLIDWKGLFILSHLQDLFHQQRCIGKNQVLA